MTRDSARRIQRDPEPVISLRDRAYAEIKRRINCLVYTPGSYLNEAQISRSLGIGRTPVHQALDRLMIEGLVRVIPRKGVMVEAISLDQVLQILDMRLLNEPHCVALAVDRATAQELAAMRDLLAEATSLIRLRDRERLMNLDRSFHRQIAGAAHNTVLAEILGLLHERSLRFWFIAFANDLQLRRIGEEHRDIFDAMARRNRDGAAAAMRAHIESSRKHIMQAI
jgi:DNA-binding GntR family transcriptional regulator